MPSVKAEVTDAAMQTHQNLRTENGVRYGDTIEGVNFPYLAQVTCLNIVSMAALALAPAPRR